MGVKEKLWGRDLLSLREDLENELLARPPSSAEK